MARTIISELLRPVLSQDEHVLFVNSHFDCLWNTTSQSRTATHAFSEKKTRDHKTTKGRSQTMFLSDACRPKENRKQRLLATFLLTKTPQLLQTK